MMPLSDKFENWYAAGEKGLLTVCEREDAPEAVKIAVHRWFMLGRRRFDVLVDEVKELEK